MEFSYIIDFGTLVDMESIRFFIDMCSDLGFLEEHRSAIEQASDLEELRPMLEDVGLVQFTGCPSPNSSIEELLDTSAVLLTE